MTAAAADSATAPAAPTAPRVPVLRGYRFELVKLLTQWRVRVLIIACWLAPAVFVTVISKQASLPVDTLFGRSMHATGWAGPLVLLGFAGSWALPLLTSLIAGDVFASEDRLGTWRHLLVAVRSPRRIFVSKALSSGTVILLLVVGLVVSSTISGVLVVGNRQLIGLDGHLLSPGDAAGAVLLAWLCALAPTLALAAIGLLGSVALGRSPMGLLLPAVVALAMQIVQQLPVPVAFRLALPGYAFISWNGLFTSPAQRGPLLIGVAVSLVWAVVATGLAYFLFVRRDFTNPTNDGSGRLAVTAGLLPLVLLLGLSTAAVAPVTGFGSGIDQDKVQRAVAVEFAHLYRLQTEQLNRADVTEEQLQSAAECTKGGDQVAARGPGNDWRCVVSWHLPGVEAAGTAIYQLDINPLGRFVADGDGPKEVNGFFLVRTPSGDQPNPLWQFDGNLELLPAH
ncbi:ABC transporter permease [Kribbella solani]|uniref:ABC transporter permease n=1 Tax=Kribbella solani TaxID=236067 RepID=UPI0029BC21D2|nr:ABC transporter permease [Kribbella solani]MDX2969590.1 ABC transporter permease [Kribbella solani]MDX3006188.1 ABC transporter permease [Kribbella solani]